MDDFFATLIVEEYGAQPVALHALPSTVSGKRYVYQVELADGQQWLMKARRQELPPLGPPDDLLQWLHDRARILVYLADHNYPAPRVIRTRDHVVVGRYHGWYALTLTWIDGILAELTPARTRQAARMLARLHNVGSSVIDQAPCSIGPSWWHPAHAVPATLNQLASVAHDIPPAWATLYHAFRTTLTTIQNWPALPQAIIHVDCWAGNLVQTASQHEVLIDWDTAGRGPAILDVGDLLIGCHFTLADPYSADVNLDPARIIAVIDGYCDHRLLTPPERAVLADAIRYGAVFRGARTFARVRHEGWTPSIERELERQRKRYLVSTDIAHIAHAHLKHVLAYSVSNDR